MLGPFIDNYCKLSIFNDFQEMLLTQISKNNLYFKCSVEIFSYYFVVNNLRPLLTIHNENTFCEVPNYTFELNVCLSVCEKTFKKKSIGVFYWKTNIEFKKHNMTLPNKYYLNRNLTFTVNLN